MHRISVQTLQVLVADHRPRTDPASMVHTQVKGAVCANINLLMEKEEEDFEKYLGTFATDIWTLLTTVSLEPRQVRSRLVVASVSRAGLVNMVAEFTCAKLPSDSHAVRTSVAVYGGQGQPGNGSSWLMNLNQWATQHRA